LAILAKFKLAVLAVVEVCATMMARGLRVAEMPPFVGNAFNQKLLA
jgi:hypothetical protein